MPLQYRRYPVNWRAVANTLKTAVDWRCQECDLPCRRPREAHVKGAAGWRRTLTVAHVYPESQAPDDEVVGVMMLCSACHARFDATKQGERAAESQRRARYRHQTSFGTQWALQARPRLTGEDLAEMELAYPPLPEDIEARLGPGVDRFAVYGIAGEEMR